MNQDIKKLNIDKNFIKKLENLYAKNNHTPNSENDSNDSNSVNTQKHKKVDIKKTIQPQKNVFSNNLEEIHQIREKNTKQNIKITIEISSYYQLSQYIFFSIFSVLLSIRVIYILFLI